MKAEYVALEKRAEAKTNEAWAKLVLVCADSPDDCARRSDRNASGFAESIAQLLKANLSPANEDLSAGIASDAISLKALVGAVQHAGQRAKEANDVATVSLVVQCLVDIASLSLSRDVQFLPTAEAATAALRQEVGVGSVSSANHSSRLTEALPSINDQLRKDEMREIAHAMQSFGNCSDSDVFPCTLDPNEVAEEISRYFAGVHASCTCSNFATPACKSALKPVSAEDVPWTFRLKSPSERQRWMSRNYERLSLKYLSFNSPKVRLSRCKRLETDHEPL